MHLLDKWTKLYESRVASCRCRHVCPVCNYLTSTNNSINFNVLFNFESLVTNQLVFMKCRKCLIPNLLLLKQNTASVYGPFLDALKYIRLYGVDVVINGKQWIAEDMEECGHALFEALFQLTLGETEKTSVRTIGDPVSPEVRTRHHPHTKLQPYWYTNLLGSQSCFLAI
jgi:hypothetical protein